MKRPLLLSAAASFGLVLGLAAAHAAVLEPGQLTNVASGAGTPVQEVLSNCYPKKVCAKWNGSPQHPWCVEWTYEQACNPMIYGPRMPPKLNKPIIPHLR